MYKICAVPASNAAAVAHVLFTVLQYSKTGTVSFCCCFLVVFSGAAGNAMYCNVSQTIVLLAGLHRSVVVGQPVYHFFRMHSTGLMYFFQKIWAMLCLMGRR